MLYICGIIEIGLQLTADLLTTIQITIEIR